MGIATLEALGPLRVSCGPASSGIGGVPVRTSWMDPVRWMKKHDPGCVSEKLAEPMVPPVYFENEAEALSLVIVDVPTTGTLNSLEVFVRATSPIDKNPPVSSLCI